MGNIQRGKEWGKRLAAARREAYLQGVECERAKASSSRTPPTTPPVAQIRVPPAAPQPSVQTSSPATKLPSKVARAPVAEAVRGAPTPMRAKQIRQQNVELEKSSGQLTRIAPAPRATQSNHTDVMRSFLEDPTGVTIEPAAFQLRCKQNCQVGHNETVSRKVVVIVSGKCRLWKLNQIIAECFDAAEHDFSPEPKKGETIPGSRFLVSRPLEPGQCSNVVICSNSLAAQAPSKSAFIDDREYRVAELFRGKSTRYGLQREPAEAAQQVVFSSPLLSADVTVSLDGIMLDSYDSQNLFDKKRRHSNGKKPLPRVVGSSFLSTPQIEALNIVMQGSQQGPDFLQRFDTSWSAIHAACRRSQRKPLFRQDGSDFDLHDLGHAAGEEDVDTDVGDSSFGDALHKGPRGEGLISQLLQSHD